MRITRQEGIRMNQQMAEEIKSYKQMDSEPKATRWGRAKHTLGVIGRAALKYITFGISECIIKSVDKYQVKKAEEHLNTEFYTRRDSVYEHDPTCKHPRAPQPQVQRVTGTNYTYDFE